MGSFGAGSDHSYTGSLVPGRAVNVHLLGNAAPSTNFLTVVAEFLALGGAIYLQRGCRACRASWRAGIGHGVLLDGKSLPSSEWALNSLLLAMGSLERFPLPVDQRKTNNFSLLYVEVAVWLWFCLQQWEWFYPCTPQGRGSGSP